MCVLQQSVLWHTRRASVLAMILYTVSHSCMVQTYPESVRGCLEILVLTNVADERVALSQYQSENDRLVFLSRTNDFSNS